MTMDMPAMPVAMTPHTWTQCLTKKECIPQQDKDCKVIKIDSNGDAFTWTVQCKTSDGVMTGNGKMTYRGDTFEDVVTMATSAGRGMGVTQNLRGKWVGNRICPHPKRPGNPSPPKAPDGFGRSARE